MVRVEPLRLSYIMIKMYLYVLKMFCLISCFLRSALEVSKNFIIHEKYSILLCETYNYSRRSTLLGRSVHYILKVQKTLTPFI